MHTFTIKQNDTVLITFTCNELTSYDTVSYTLKGNVRQTVGRAVTREKTICPELNCQLKYNTGGGDKSVSTITIIPNMENDFVDIRIN